MSAVKLTQWCDWLGGYLCADDECDHSEMACPMCFMCWGKKVFSDEAAYTSGRMCIDPCPDPGGPFWRRCSRWVREAQRRWPEENSWRARLDEVRA